MNKTKMQIRLFTQDYYYYYYYLICLWNFFTGDAENKFIVYTTHSFAHRLWNLILLY